MKPLDGINSCCICRVYNTIHPLNVVFFVVDGVLREKSLWKMYFVTRRRQKSEECDGWRFSLWRCFHSWENIRAAKCASSDECYGGFFGRGNEPFVDEYVYVDCSVDKNCGCYEKLTKTPTFLCILNSCKYEKVFTSPKMRKKWSNVELFNIKGVTLSPYRSRRALCWKITLFQRKCSAFNDVVNFSSS